MGRGWAALHLIFAAPAIAAPIEPVERRLLLPRVPPDAAEVSVPAALRASGPLLDLRVDRVELRSAEGLALEPDAARLELDGLPPAQTLDAGTELAGRIVLRTRDLVAAGEYPLEVAGIVWPADDLARAPGPPAPRPFALQMVISRRIAALEVAAPGRIELRVLPWEERFSAGVRLHVSETSGRSGMPPLELLARGPALDPEHGGRPAALALESVAPAAPAGPETADLELRIAGSAGAGRYRLPLELRSGGAAAPVPVDLEVWLRHPAWALAAALVLGTLLGVAIRWFGSRKERALAAGDVLAEGRAAIERLRDEAVDRPLRERLDAVVDGLRRREQRSGAAGEAGRAVIEAHNEALNALKDLESRRLAADAALGELEAALVPAPSDPPEIESTLQRFLRRIEELRHRLDRGEVAEVEAATPGMRIEAGRELGEAGKRWLVIARDLLDALRARIPQSARVHLVESVRLTLETFAARIAEGSTERIRDTILAGRAAATTLSEQCFALAYKPVLRDLGELVALLSELMPEAQLRPLESARRGVETALEPGPLVEPFRSVEALGGYQAAAEAALETLAAEAWKEEAWKPVREALTLKEFARVTEAVDTLLRHRGRERQEARRRSRVLEIVRLAPRPSPPRLRIEWDSPPTVGFPMLARLVWMGSEPRRYSVRWAAEGLAVKAERAGIPGTSLVFSAAGFASLKAVVEIEGEIQPLVAWARLRVLPAGPPAPRGLRRGPRSAWALLQALFVAAVALGAGQALLAGRFTGTPGDYALALGFGLLLDFLADRLGALVTRRAAPAS